MNLGQLTEIEKMGKDARLLVVAHGQGDTFDEELLKRDILEPIKALIEGREVDVVVLATPINPRCPGAEETVEVASSEGNAPYKISRTGKAIAALSKEEEQILQHTSPTARALAGLKESGEASFLERVRVVTDAESVNSAELTERARKLFSQATVVHVTHLGQDVPSSLGVV